jgi:hypothetical protein
VAGAVPRPFHFPDLASEKDGRNDLTLYRLNQMGPYCAVRAGYSLVGAEEVWEAVAMECPNSLRIGKDHPTAEEIADKQKRNLPLVPDPKVIKVNSTPPERPDIH